MGKPKGYSWEKLFVAVDSLATGTDSLQMRLANAFGGSLMRLTPKDFPEELRPRFEFIERMMTTAEPQGDEGPIVATARKMSDREAVDVAKAILSLYHDIAEG